MPALFLLFCFSFLFFLLSLDDFSSQASLPNLYSFSSSFTLQTSFLKLLFAFSIPSLRLFFSLLSLLLRLLFAFSIPPLRFFFSLLSLLFRLLFFSSFYSLSYFFSQAFPLSSFPSLHISSFLKLIFFFSIPSLAFLLSSFSSLQTTCLQIPLRLLFTFPSLLLKRFFSSPLLFSFSFFSYKKWMYQLNRMKEMKGRR